MRWLDDVRDWWERRTVPFTCRHVVELMTDYLEGALGPEDRERFEAHLAHCDSCTNYLDQLRATIGVLGTVRVGEPAPAVRADLLDFYRRYRDD